MNLIENQPLVSVGIPTYNRPEGLRRTLECINSQTYQNLEIIVSDNGSPGPETGQVVREFIERNPTIQYFRQEENRGGYFNFNFVLEKASGEYFMWAADDDEWDHSFIETCLNKKFISGKCSLSFSNIVNINSKGQISRYYPSFEKFVSKSLLISSCMYTLSHEYNGKANLFYGIYNRSNLIKNFYSMKNFDSSGSDMVFVLKNILDSGVCINKNVLFKKGGVELRNSREIKDLSIKDLIKSYDIPFDYYKCFIKNIIYCKYSFILIIIMTIKFSFAQVFNLPQMAYNTVKQISKIFPFNQKYEIEEE